MGMDGLSRTRAPRARLLIVGAVATAVFVFTALVTPVGPSSIAPKPAAAAVSCGGGPPASNCDSDANHLLRYGTLKRLDLGGGRIDPGELAVSTLAGVVRDSAIKYVLKYLASYIYPAAVPIVGWLYTIANLAVSLIDVIKQVEGGTPIMVQRFSGRCADVPEVFSEIKATHSAFSMSTDLLWTAAVSASTQYIRDFNRKYLGNSQVSCDTLRNTLTAFPMLKPNGHWATAQANGFTKSLTCDQKTAGHAESIAIERAAGTTKTTLRRYCSLVSNP